jgi:hypothetical protein
MSFPQSTGGKAPGIEIIEWKTLDKEIKEHNDR